jgi:DNA helicase-2/ATP-dependent DNA helicase PcrA
MPPGHGQRPTTPDLLDDLTPAQQEAVTHFEGPLLILAGAGSGKTRVITRRVAWLLRQGVRPSNILAITFTNKAAGEMRQRVEALVPNSRVWVSTFHSLGARLLRQYHDRVIIDRNFTIYDQADRTKVVKDALEAAGIDNVRFTPDRIAGAISKAKNQLLTPERYEQKAGDFFSQTVARVYYHYEKKLREANALDFDDLLMIPALALRHDEELRTELDGRFRFVLIDEYQDTNTAQYEIARRLSVDQPNICVVGDPDQCLLPGTLVQTTDGLKPIEMLQEGDEVITGTGWGKTSTMAIEKVMVNPYSGPAVAIEVAGGIRVRATPNHICFARLQPSPAHHYVYLMWKRGVGYRLGTTRGVRTSKDGLIMSGLQVRTNQEVADAVWIVRSCRTSAEARFYEHYYSVRYGIPTMVFFVRGRRMDMTQEWIDRLYCDIDTQSAAARLMAEHHLDRRYPHHRPGAVIRGDLARRHVMFTVFGDPRPKLSRCWHEHRVQLVTSGEELRERAAAQFSVRNGQRGTWRIETSRKCYEDGLDLATQISQLDEFDLIPRARLTPARAFAFTPAGHIHPGMVVPVLEGDHIVEREVTSVSWEDYEGPVYDISIPHTRNFIANGLVVHNSIYKWRGSDIRNILDFERDFPDARVITLDLNYRSTKSILAAADALIAHNKQRKPKDLRTDNPRGEPVRLLTFDTGLDEAEGVVRRIKDAHHRQGRPYRDFAVFLRINALSRTLEAAFVKHGVPFQIVKGLAFFERKENRDVLAYLRLLVNPQDNLSFLRVVNEPARGVGDVSLKHLRNYAEPRELPLLAAAGEVAKVPQIRGKASAGLRDFHRLMADLRQHLDEPPDELIRLVLEKSGYRAMLKGSGDEDDQERLANIEELITAARQFAQEDSSRTIGDFLEQITLASDVDGWDERQDCVSVMTLHTAKGLEFPVVYMLAVEQGLLPHERSLAKDEDVEEERRLCFVGMTRAKQELNLCHARLREFRGQALYAVPSMFLEELPHDGVVEAVDLCHHSGGAQAPDFWRGGSAAAASGWHDAGYAPRPPARPKPDENGYAVGVIVEHDSYGRGQITDLSGHGALRRVKIRFARHGEKTFVVEKVKLTVIDDD